MDKEFPLFPELSKEGRKEAQVLIDKFKEELIKVASRAIRDLYTDIVGYIETDSWTNFRNEMMHGFKDYHNTKIHAKYDFRDIRDQMFKENREEIINDLNQDLIKKIADLEGTIEILRRH